MPCSVISLGNGATAIVCTRGGGKRCTCGRTADKLCDYPLRGEKAGKTCDRAFCSRCGKHVGPNKDYCPAHGRLEK
jgi:hypothetical protein